MASLVTKLMSEFSTSMETLDAARVSGDTILVPPGTLEGVVTGSFLFIYLFVIMFTCGEDDKLWIGLANFTGT